ncbi:MAG TPA: hypothetical protein VK524_25665, partial [Polyangiaceae bacterium]|nr:hypothetical protein [Polyangiaceae bacterium]
MKSKAMGRSRYVRALTAAVALSGAALTTPAQAAPIDAEPMSQAKLRIDGLLREWSSRFFPLSEVVQGSGAGGEPVVSAQLGYDEKFLYLALRIA